MRKSILAALAAVALGLSACGADNTEPPQETPETVEETTEESADETTDEATEEATTEEEVTEEEATEEEATPEAASDYVPVQMGEPPAERAAPGTEYTAGEFAWVSVELGEDEEGGESASPDPNAETTTTVVGITVLDIVEGDVSYFDKFSNAEEFAGNIPYFIVYQQNFITADHPAGEEPTEESLWPQFADGTDAQYLTSFGIARSKDCGIELPDYDPATGILLDCFIGLGTPDKPVERVVYNGMGQWSIVYDETDIYVENPLVWTKG